MREEKVETLLAFLGSGEGKTSKRTLIDDLTRSNRDLLLRKLVRRLWDESHMTDRLCLAEAAGVPMSRLVSIACSLTRIALKHRENFFKFDATSQHAKVRETLSLIEGWCDGLVPTERLQQWHEERRCDHYKDNETMTLLHLVDRLRWPPDVRQMRYWYLRAFFDLTKCLEYSDHIEPCKREARAVFDRLLPWSDVLAELER